MIQINFMLVIGPLFQEYEPCFQTQEPLIHMLYPECVGVLKNVLMRFLKFEVVSGKSSSTIINIDCGNLDNCKSLKDMDIGPEVCDALSKLDGGRQKGMRTFYQQVSKHLSKKLPLQESVVKHAHCLHPEIKYQDHAMKMITQLAVFLPNIANENVTKAGDAWNIYREENVEDDVVYDEDSMLKRVDMYWNDILDRKTAAGILRYPALKNVVTSCLCLVHGNADVEISLSINKKILTPERTLMYDATLNSLRLTRDAVSRYGNATSVLITRKMITFVQGPYT